MNAIHFGETPREINEAAMQNIYGDDLARWGIFIELVKACGSSGTFLEPLPENSATIAFCSQFHRDGDVLSQLMS